MCDDDNDSILSVCGAQNCCSVKNTTDIIVGATSSRMLTDYYQ
jgi:hypothetical protein